MVHADLFHDALRPEVGRGGEGDDLVECERAERVVEDGAGGLGGKPPTPLGASEAPSDLD